SAHPKVSPSRSTAEGARELTPKEKDLLVHLGNGLSKPTDNVGQQLNDKFKVWLSQSSCSKKAIKIKD
ncbi:MAG: hypothetical protein RSA22_12220, partial [Acinetobacter sp.]